MKISKESLRGITPSDAEGFSIEEMAEMMALLGEEADPGRFSYRGVEPTAPLWEQEAFQVLRWTRANRIVDQRQRQPLTINELFLPRQERDKLA